MRGYRRTLHYNTCMKICMSYMRLIISYVRLSISYVRFSNTISYVRLSISYVRLIISYVRLSNTISYVRLIISYVRLSNTISYVRLSISYVRLSISIVRLSISYVQHKTQSFFFIWQQYASVQMYHFNSIYLGMIGAKLIWNYRFKNRICSSPQLLPCRGDVALRFKKVESLFPRMFYAKFGWNLPCVLF